MHKYSRRRLPLLLAGLFPISGFAADVALSTSPVVVSATRVEQNSFDLPVSIDSISGEQMQNGQLMVNASETLSRIPGIVAPNTYRFSSDEQISSRGFGTRAAFGIRGIRIYSDGIPQTMPDGQGQMSTFALGSAERMEVMRGPFSALYGNSSGGVVQVFTRSGRGAPLATASAYVGSYGTRRASLIAEGKVNDLGYVLDASRFQTDGYRLHSAARRDQINAKLDWSPGSGTRATLILASVDQPYNDDPQGLTRAQMDSDPRQASTAATLSFNAGGSKSQTHIGLDLEHRINGTDTLRATGWSGVRDVTTRLSFGGTGPLSAGGISLVDRNFYGTDLRWTRRTTTDVGALVFTVGANYEAMKDLRTGFVNVNGTQGALKRDEDNLATTYGIYAQGEWSVGKDWIISGGLRSTKVILENRDRYIVGANPDDSGLARYSNTSPVLGVVYHLTPEINLYANAGKGFETPAFIELAYRAAGSGLNFALQPSVSRNYEVGAKAFLGSATRLNLALFNATTDNEIVIDSSAGGRTVYANAGQTRRTGVELALDSRLSENLNASFSLAHINARFVDAYTNTAALTIAAGNKLPGTPAITAFGELSWRHPSTGFSTAVEARYSDKIFVDDVNSDAAEAYTVLNWRGGFEQKAGDVTLKEFLRVDNLGNRRYTGGILVGSGSPFAPAPERSFAFGISAALKF